MLLADEATESDVDRDLLRLANKLSRKLTKSQEKRHRKSTPWHVKQPTSEGEDSHIDRKDKAQTKRELFQAPESEGMSNTSPRKRKLEKKSTKERKNDSAADGSPLDTEHEGDKSSKRRHLIDDVDDSVDEDREDVDGNLVTNPSLRYTPPEGFQAMKADHLITEKDLEGKELYLIRAPEDLDIEKITNQRFNLKKRKHYIQTENDATYEVVTQKCTDSIYSPIVYNPDANSLHLHPGVQISGQINITPGVEIPPLPEIEIPPPIKHKIPKGLKVRYQPFGSDDPIIIEKEDVEMSGGKHKKDRKHKHHKKKHKHEKS